MPRINFTLKLLLIGILVTFMIQSLAERLTEAAPSVEIKPALMLGGRYDSNFFLTKEDEQALYSYIVSPGVSASIEGSRTRIDIDYSLEAHFFEEADDPSSEEVQREIDDSDYLGHIASLDSQFDLTSRLFFGLNGTYILTRYPTYYDRFSTQTWKREYELFQLTPSLYFDVTKKLTTGLSLRTSELDLGSVEGEGPDADGLDADNTQESTWTLDIGWTPQPSIGVDLDLEYTDVDYVERPDDYEAQRAMLNIQKRFRIIAFDGGVGYDRREYRETEFEDQELITWRAGISAQAPIVTGPKRRPSRNYVRPVEHLYFAVERRFNTIGDLFTATRFIGSVGSRIGEKFESRIKGWYQISDYIDLRDQTTGEDPAAQELRSWDISASLGFKIFRNLMLAVTVGYREAESDSGDDDYKDNYGMINLNYNFDAWRRGGFTNEALYY